MQARGWLMAQMFVAASSMAAEDGALPGPLSEIGSCARSGPTITLDAADSRVLLDTADRDRVQAAIVERYPLLQRDGFASPYILLWRKAGGDWLYVSLIVTDEPTPILCFTATFTAKGFALTRDLLQKYFAGGAAPT